MSVLIETCDDLDELALVRSAGYAFLSRSFERPLTNVELGVLQDEGFMATSSELFGSEPVSAMRVWYQANKSSVVESDLRHEFTRLFLVPGGGSIAPYESVFRDVRDVEGQSVKGLLMGKSAVDVQQWYRLATLDISPEFQDLPDHIALELRYLAAVSAMEPEFAASGELTKLRRAREMQRDFLAAHIQPWVGEFSVALKDKSKHPFFNALADMVVNFTSRDLILLEQTIGKSTGDAIPAYTGAP